VIGFANGVGDATAPVGHRLLFLTVNPFQDFTHLAIGLLLRYAGLKWTSAATEGVLHGLGGIYVIAAVTGFTYPQIPVITIVTAGNVDNDLHAITGATAIPPAVVSMSSTNRQARSAY